MLTNFIYYKNAMSERMFGMGLLRNCGGSLRVRDILRYASSLEERWKTYICVC